MASARRGRFRRGLPLLLGLAFAWLAVAGGSVETRRKSAILEPAMTTTPPPHHAPNRLIHEKSPYLLQHAYNPVDWYPWGEEAFEKARREERPIFLSIGYSTCHWCHVMERESFENDSVAALINRYFVPIKVDREERPDVDRLYMTAMQAMGMGGGWPLNVFLTPKLEPFYGGTYFPPDSRHGRAGLIEMLPSVHEAWMNHRAEIEKNGGNVVAALASYSRPDQGSTDRARLFHSAYDSLSRTFDAAHGGFGNAPKFPSIANLDFLMRWWAADPTARRHALEMTLAQLDHMRAGGIHDHLGGGFHRYSTDREWLVPHFEKMLYDQAQIAWGFLEAYQATGREEYAATARDVFDYVARDLSAPEGGFYSAEDADSEGEEGRFYVWTPDQIESVLGAPDGEIFRRHYDVTHDGNFEHGASILHETHSVAETAAHFHRPAREIAERLARSRAKLLEARSHRVRPHRDDKVITAWNGLMISAFARGARVLDDDRLRERAARAADFIWDHLRDEKSGELMRRWREGESRIPGQLDDYACYALGLIDLYEATLDPRWLERAVSITEAELTRFWDDRDGGFFSSPAGDPHLRVRMKDDFDGAELAGNSVAAWNLQTLATLLDRDAWRDQVKRMLDYYARRLEHGPIAMPQMMVAMQQEQATPRHIVIAGDRDASDTRAMRREFDRRFLPHDVLLLASGDTRQRLAGLAPFAASLEPRDGRATAYVCVHYACRLPTHDAAEFARQLDAATPVQSAQGGSR
jgi:uncharacterized protein YyaL (SSP411 family)